MKVKEWLPVWLENYVKPTAKEKTYTRYSEVVTHHLIPRIGELGMSEVTPLTLQQMVTELSAHGNLRIGSGLSAKSPFECLCSYFILPEFFEHVYPFALFSICEKYYTIDKAPINRILYFPQHMIALYGQQRRP